MICGGDMEYSKLPLADTDLDGAHADAETSDADKSLPVSKEAMLEA